MINKSSEIILTFFYVGKIKFAPGTFASLICALLWYFFPYNIILRLLFVIFILLIGFYFCYKYSCKPLLGEDPSEIVIDEFAGMSIALFVIEPSIELYILGFSLFRFFDILKPSFIYHSQYFKNGLGIMMDDILAGMIVLLFLLGIGAK